MNNCKKMTVHFLSALGVAASIGLTAVSANVANAQGSLLQQTPGIEAKGVKEKQPLLMQADNVTYDNQNNRVLATGNVEIYYNGYTLLADRVIYDRKFSNLTAEGNVRIKEPSGSVVNAHRITLNEDFTQGFIQSLKVVSQDDSRIAASRAQRVDGNTTVFENGIFTPCKQCKDRKAPLWRVKARKIIHKKDEQNIFYEDASLEIFGVPVAYIPYFSHPDPTDKRRSGFLMPKVTSSTELGFGVEIPYFYEIAPNKDFTFSPLVTSKKGVFFKAEWRHRTKNGQYSISGGGIFENDQDPQFDRNDFRGTIQTVGNFRMSKTWNFGWDITAETDDTVRRIYGLDSKTATDRVSRVYATRQTERNWLEANLYHFGALTSLDASNAEAFVHPSLDYNHIFGSPILGGELSFDANIASLSRNDGTDSSRLTAHLKWRRTLVDSLGQVYRPFFQARGDVYHISSDVPGEDDGFVTRAQAVGGMTYSYPLIKRTANASHVIAPKVQIVGRPDIDANNNVPNEDARSLVFDDTILFDVDKFSGYDRMETGVRANVGVEYTMQLNSGGYARAVLGQSYHITGENSFEEGTGLDTTNSDVIAGLYLKPSANLTFLSQARFDDKDFSIKRTDLFVHGAYGPFTGSVNYAKVDAEPSIGIPDDREEVLAAASLQISDYWSVFGSARFNIADDEFIEDALGLKYADECFVLAVTYNESNITDEDIEKDQKVMVRFELKHLGGTSFSTDVGKDFIANAPE